MAGTGRTQTVMQVGFVVITLAYFLYLIVISNLSLGWGPYKIIIPLVLAGRVVSHGRYRARKRADRQIAENLPDSGRPTVIYLRSFDSDPSPIKNLEPIPNVLTSLLSYPAGPNADIEDPLALAVAPIGQMVKLGRPGKKTFWLGAPCASKHLIINGGMRSIAG